MEILRRNDIKIEGANAVVLGRSDIVGKPMALLLMHANATVTICHSKTRDLPDVLRRADIVIRRHGQSRLRGSGLDQARRNGHRCRHNRVRRPQRSRAAFSQLSRPPRKIRAQGSALIGDVIPAPSTLPVRSRPCPAASAP